MDGSRTLRVLARTAQHPACHSCMLRERRRADVKRSELSRGGGLLKNWAEFAYAAKSATSSDISL
eukprot:540325-Prymnesium_polylepis.1